MQSWAGSKIKRKNGSFETKTEPARKALKKAELLIQFDALEQKYLQMESSYKAVLKEKETLLEAINLLEETVQVLQRKEKKVWKFSWNRNRNNEMWKVWVSSI